MHSIATIFCYFDWTFNALFVQEWFYKKHFIHTNVVKDCQLQYVTGFCASAAQAWVTILGHQRITNMGKCWCLQLHCFSRHAEVWRFVCDPAHCDIHATWELMLSCRIGTFMGVGWKATSFVLPSGFKSTLEVWVVYGCYAKIKKSAPNMCMNMAEDLNQDDVFLTSPVKHVFLSTNKWQSKNACCTFVNQHRFPACC